MRTHRFAELNWQGNYDPVWTIDPGEGPATLRGEPTHHQLEEKPPNEAAQEKTLQQRADQLGCSLELARYVEILERQLGITIYAVNEPA